MKTDPSALGDKGTYDSFFWARVSRRAARILGTEIGDLNDEGQPAPAFEPAEAFWENVQRRANAISDTDELLRALATVAPARDRRRKAQTDSWDEEFTELYKAHYSTVASYCARYLRGVSGAEHLAHDAATRAFEMLHIAHKEGRPPKDVLPWLMSYARVEGVLFMRRQRIRSAGNQAELDVQFPDRQHSDNDLADLTSFVSNYLASRGIAGTAFKMVTVDGDPIWMVADKLGINPNRVRDHVLRVRNELMQELGRRGWAE